MKRDMDLCRQILLEVEGRSYAESGQPMTIDGQSAEHVSYQVMLLAQAGLIEAIDARTLGPDGFLWLPMWLTWHGHEFLDASRSPERWTQAKMLIKSRAGEVGFDVLKAVLTSLAMKALGVV